MAIIQYIEPVNPGTLFAGMGALVVSLVIAWILYRFYKLFIEWFDTYFTTDMKYRLLEESQLDDIAKEKGIDLNKKVLERRIMKQQEKSFRKTVEKEVYKRMFGDKK